MACNWKFKIWDNDNYSHYWSVETKCISILGKKGGNEFWPTDIKICENKIKIKDLPGINFDVILDFLSDDFPQPGADREAHGLINSDYYPDNMGITAELMLHVLYPPIPCSKKF